MSQSILSLVVAALFLACYGLSTGLTYAPCYSTMCVEQYFPYQTRLHLVVFYGFLFVTWIVAQVVRGSWKLKQIMSWPLSGRSLPFVSVEINAIGIVLVVWIAALVFAPMAYWIRAETVFWYEKGAEVDWTVYIGRVVWTGITGHWCDVLLGLVVLPVGHNGVISKLLGVHATTAISAHRLLAYALLIGGLIHGLLYYSFLGAWVEKTDAADNDTIRNQFLPDNPAITWEEAGQEGYYSWLTLPTGALAGLVVIVVMAVTSLPILRRRHYNIFYATHLTLAIIFIVSLCLHASTNFYLVLPGLVLWLIDWILRLRKLGESSEVIISDAGNGWTKIEFGSGDLEKVIPEKAMPLQICYIQIEEISWAQSHAFTIASQGSRSTVLVRNSMARKNVEKTQAEWTWRLAKMKGMYKARIDGPYTEEVNISYANHIYCIVGGSGITGALSLARWWVQEKKVKQRFTIVWTVREASYADIEDVRQVQQILEEAGALFRIHVSSKEGRLPVQDELRTLSALNEDVWIYSAGPSQFLEAVAVECRLIRRSMGALPKRRFEWYASSYSL